MLELLQKLWDEYELLVAGIDDTDCICDSGLENLIVDTTEMEELRIKLIHVGVKLR